MLDDDAVHDVGHVVETVDDLLQMVVDLVADEEGERDPPCALGAVEFAQADVVQVVGVALELRRSAR